MASTISVVMIVRDEEERLARCLGSVANLVDEIVVVDTGSHDGTIAVAERFGAKVHDFPWVENFSAARNHSLERATGDWRLVLDADDWLEDDARAALPAFREVAPDFVGAVRYASLGGDPADAQLHLSWAARLLPPDARYRGRVHEQVVSAHPYRDLEHLTIHHDGYLADRVASKGDRNRRLLAADLEDRPNDPYLLYQLGREIGMTLSADLGADTLGLAMRFAPPLAAYRCDLVVRWLANLVAAGRGAEAIDVGAGYRDEFAASPDYWYELGRAYEAERRIDEAVACWERCLALGESSPFSSATVGRGSTAPAAKIAEHRS